MGMTQKQREKWAKTRQMGRTRFVWLTGVAGWGLEGDQTHGNIVPEWGIDTTGWNQ